jgi:type II secretory pathway predicted ATPase ExeA
MYQSYWQLTQRPFENCSDPRFYYPCESHQAALLKLRYAIENRRQAALLAGAAGLGKTLLVGMLRDALGEDFTPFAHLVYPQMATDQWLAYLADELDGSRTGAASPEVQQSVRRIEAFLASCAEQGRHPVVAVDEAHVLADSRTLEALRLLMNFQSGDGPGLTLLLVGQPGILPTLDRTPQLEERIAVKCLLRPLTEQETAGYVTHRLKVAGTTRAIFDAEAITALQQLAHGIPRRINRLCDLALLIGYAEEQDTITAAHLEAVSDELVTVVPE